MHAQESAARRKAEEELASTLALKKQQEDMMAEMQASLQDAAKQAKEELEATVVAHFTHSFAAVGATPVTLLWYRVRAYYLLPHRALCARQAMKLKTQKEIESMRKQAVEEAAQIRKTASEEAEKHSKKAKEKNHPPKPPKLQTAREKPPEGSKEGPGGNQFGTIGGNRAVTPPSTSPHAQGSSSPRPSKPSLCIPHPRTINAICPTGVPGAVPGEALGAPL